MILRSVGEAAHMIAEEDDGPRGNSPLPKEQRNKYQNLILLCNVHHKQVDDQPSHFTVEKLRSIKAAHEQWVRECLTGFDPSKQAEDELWAAYIDEWAHRAYLDDWLNIAYGFLEPQPVSNTEIIDTLSSLREWILSRVWPEHCVNLTRCARELPACPRRFHQRV